MRGLLWVERGVGGGWCMERKGEWGGRVGGEKGWGWGSGGVGKWGHLDGISFRYVHGRPQLHAIAKRTYGLRSDVNADHAIDFLHGCFTCSLGQ